MPKGKSKYLPIPAIIIDMVLLFNAFLTAGFIVFDGKFPDPIFYYKLLLGWSIIWIVIVLNLKLYDLPRIFYIDKIILKNVEAVVIFIFISSSFIYFLSNYAFSRKFFLLAMGLFLGMLILWHAMMVVLFKAYRKKGNNFKNIVIIGCNEPVEQLIDEVFLLPENGYKIKGIFGSTKPTEHLSKFYKGKEDELLNYLNENAIDELLISLPPEQSDLINNYMNYADNKMIRVHILPNFSKYLFQKFTINYINNVPTLSLREEPLESLSNRIMKRVFDILFSSFVLIFICSWLFPILALLIKLTSKGPVFFSQLRSGKEDNAFKCLKFRSMTVNSNSDHLQASKNDTRITTIGKILRKTSLDEFPQFLNVLMGNMSVVGPRPHMLKHTDEYKKLVDKYMVRHYSKPGITGWAQIKGFRGETKQVQDMANRAEADIWYIENWNVFLDLKIIFLTVWQVVFKKEDNAF